MVHVNPKIPLHTALSVHNRHFTGVRCRAVCARISLHFEIAQGNGKRQGDATRAIGQTQLQPTDLHRDRAAQCTGHSRDPDLLHRIADPNGIALGHLRRPFHLERLAAHNLLCRRQKFCEHKAETRGIVQRTVADGCGSCRRNAVDGLGRHGHGCHRHFRHDLRLFEAENVDAALLRGRSEVEQPALNASGFLPLQDMFLPPRLSSDHDGEHGNASGIGLHAPLGVCDELLKVNVHRSPSHLIAPAEPIGAQRREEGRFVRCILRAILVLESQHEVGVRRHHGVVCRTLSNAQDALVAEISGHACTQQNDNHRQVKQQNGIALPLQQFVLRHVADHRSAEEQEQHFEPLGLVDPLLGRTGAKIILDERRHGNRNGKKRDVHHRRALIQDFLEEGFHGMIWPCSMITSYW